MKRETKEGTIWKGSKLRSAGGGGGGGKSCKLGPHTKRKLSILAAAVTAILYLAHGNWAALVVSRVFAYAWAELVRQASGASREHNLSMKFRASLRLPFMSIRKVERTAADETFNSWTLH